MALVNGSEILKEAIKGKYGVGAFNVNNMEQLQGIMKAARETRSPVIIQASRGGLKYTNIYYLSKLFAAAVEDNTDIPFAINLDHGNSFEICKKAIELGFTSVMIDGSLREDGKTPSSFKENVDRTGEVVEYAHRRGVSVEGELGTLGGLEDGIGSGKTVTTDPYEAKKFVELTGVDMLAVSVGTSHGVNKFKKDTRIRLDIIENISQLLPDTPLVLHGASSVPLDLIRKINKYGGDLEETIGVPIDTIIKAIGCGIRKVNIDTDMRLAMTADIRESLDINKGVFDPRKYFGAARDAVYKIVSEKMHSYGSAGAIV